MTWIRRTLPPRPSPTATARPTIGGTRRPRRVTSDVDRRKRGPTLRRARAYVASSCQLRFDQRVGDAPTYRAEYGTATVVRPRIVLCVSGAHGADHGAPS